MRSDCLHGLIGRSLRCEPEVLDFDDLSRLIRSAKKGLQILPLAPASFFPFTSFWSRNAPLPKLTGITEVHFKQGSVLFHYKLDLDAPKYFTRPFTTRDIPVCPLSENRARGINPLKKAEICRTLCPQMPQPKRVFWNGLEEANVGDLCLKQC